MILFFIISGKRYDEKVDIFSFGIVLCEVRTDVTLIICSDNKAHSLQTAVLKTASAELYRWIMTTKPWQNIIPLNALEKKQHVEFTRRQKRCLFMHWSIYEVIFCFLSFSSFRLVEKIVWNSFNFDVFFNTSCTSSPGASFLNIRALFPQR